MGGTLEEDSRTYTCNVGTVQESGPSSIVCQNNGMWSSTDLYCRRRFLLIIPFLNLGQLHVTYEKWNLFFSSAYQVKRGYKAQKNCTKNLTLYIFVKIIYVLIADCGAPPVVTRATISAGNTLEGSIRMYTCDANTLTQGTINTRCQLNGQWTSVDLYCRRE